MVLGICGRVCGQVTLDLDRCWVQIVGEPLVLGSDCG